MKKLFIISALLSCVSLTTKLNAQIYLQDINGQPFMERNLADLGGSPFFNDEFLKGSIKMDDKSVYGDLFLRYDLESDQLVYRKINSTVSMAPKGNVAEFKIDLPNGTAATFKRLPASDGNDEGFYQVIADGKTSLLKKTKKRIVERIEYNSSTKSKTLASQTTYFLLTGDKLVPVKNDKKGLIKALGGNQEGLQSFVDREKINFKSDYDLGRFIAYYNSTGV
ncbi:MAG: hypothetical protein V4687_13455 [Bacteroidota bacterium]